MTTTFLHRRTVLRAALLAFALALFAAPSAQAAFSGSNGMVAFLDAGDTLYVDDPYDEAGPRPLAHAEGDGATSRRSPPNWSPDGTRVTYTDAIPDTSPLPDHSAVFMVERNGSAIRQLSRPFPGVIPCHLCETGEYTYDYGPAFSPDGRRVAFIRFVHAEDNAAHVNLEGTSIWVASVDGTSETMISPTTGTSGAWQSLVWPEGASAPYGIFVAKATKQYEIRRVDSGTVLASAPGIMDFDVSPDGKSLLYITIGGAGWNVFVVGPQGTPPYSFSLGFNPAEARFSPDGNSVLHRGCTTDREGQQHCGIIAHRLPDPDGDVRPDEPQSAPYLDLAEVLPGGPVVPGRSNFDVQSQDWPIVFVPGFLGSEIECQGDVVWMPTFPSFDFDLMRMADDGVTNTHCPDAGPNGKMVDSFLTVDVYGGVERWIAGLEPAGGFKALGWDWRKRPQEAWDELGQTFTTLLAGDLPQKQGVSKVTVMGHSYGALLTRTYIDDPARAKAVGRFLAVGPPWWGAPKGLFPVVFGVETAISSGLDAFFDNDDLKAFAQNMAGVYYLFPDSRYGPWLSLTRSVQDQAGVSQYIDRMGGNPAILAEAQATHDNLIAGYLDYGGRIDDRVVVGVGTPTIHSVDVVNHANGTADVTLQMGDGDVTVPDFSANQGPVGSESLGDPIHTQYLCHTGHMSQSADPLVMAAYEQWLLTGRHPRKMPKADCPAEGSELRFPEMRVPAPPTPAEGVAGSTRSAAAPRTIGEAAMRGEIDLLDFPGEPIVILRGTTPVPLTFVAAGQTFTATPLHGDKRGATLTYGPLTGTVVIEQGDNGVPVVQLDGKVVTPEGGTVPPGGGGPTVPVGGGSTPPPETGPDPEPAKPLKVRLTIGKVVTLSKTGTLSVRVGAVERATRGTLTLTTTGQRPTRLVRVNVSLAAGRAKVVAVKLGPAARTLLKVKGKLAVKAAIDLRDAGAQKAQATASFTLRTPPRR